MKNKAAADHAGKRVAVTVYMSQSLSERIRKGYAAALIDGYTGTKQSYIAQLLESALTAAQKEV